MAAEEPFAGGVDGEVARGFSAAGGVLDKGEFAGFRIAGVDDDGVVAAVGAVDEFSVGVDFDFGGGVLAFEIGGECGDGLNFC